MPPPIQQTGSKAGLISWTIIATVLMLVAVVLAFIANADASKTRHELDSANRKLQDLVENTETSATINSLKAAMGQDNPDLPKDVKVLEFAVAQRDLLAKRLAGSPDLTPALLAYQAASSDAAAAMGKDAKAAEGTTGAVGVIQSLVAQITEKNAQLKALQDQVAAAKAEHQRAIVANTEAGKQFAASIDASGKKVNEIETSAGTDRTNNQAVVADATKQMTEAQAAKDAAIAESTAKIAATQKELTSLKQQLAAARSQIEKYRQNAADPITTHADARVTKIGTDDIVYIDLGQGDHLAPGTSFEVYDRFEGVPKLRGDSLSDDSLPKGKASIEVVRVLPGLAEARIVRRTRGMTITEGDYVSNLVYDKNIPFKFVVYGNFDLDRNKSATPQDADIIRRLITQWGGQTTDNLDVTVDFLVIGAVPEIPSFTQEELDQPDLRARKEAAEKALNAYNDVVNKAIELHIPILNQNRFLYYTGYYEQSAR